MDKDIANNPQVTIMMTTYNRGEYITAAIDSVLQQTYQDWELLVLDDASTDNTKGLILRYSNDPRVVYVPSSTNLGITKNRNRGFILAKGKYIAVLDSDDLWIDPDKLTKQVQFLETNPDYVIVGSNVKVINNAGANIGNFIYATEDAEIRRRLLLRNQFTHSSLLLRSDAFNQFAPYDNSLPIWEDYELVLRLGQKGKLANLSEEMTAYRKHSNNISKTARQKGALTHLSIIKKYRDSYPYYHLALLKSYVRFLISFV